MKRIFLILVALVLAACAMAQVEEKPRPGWTRKVPKEDNNTYFYLRQTGNGKTVAEARDRALAEVYRQAIMRLGLPVDASIISQSLQQGDVDWTSISAKYNLPINKVCEHVETCTSGYLVFVLCQVAKAGNIAVNFTTFRGCDDTKTESARNVASVFESIFLPGLGQMTKRRGGHGTGVLLGELAFAGGAVTSWYFAKQELTKMQDPKITLADFQTAKRNYNICRIANISALSAAAALYVANIFQAGFIKPKYKSGRRSLSFNPALIPTEDDMAAGVGLTYNF